jgi:hypothetical protein
MRPKPKTYGQEGYQRVISVGQDLFLSCLVSWASVLLIVDDRLWQPLWGPVTDWPLGLCNATSVDPTKDFANMDVVFRNVLTENYQIYPNDKHSWYYLNKQVPSEIWLFRQADTEEGFPGKAVKGTMMCDSVLMIDSGVPHSSFIKGKEEKDERPRGSIETCAFIYF